MKPFIYTMIIVGLMIYFASPIINQYDRYLWYDWYTVINGLYNFPLAILLFHLYRKSKYEFWLVNWIFVGIVAFASIDFVHAIRVFYLWALGDSTMNAVLVTNFNQYNPFSCLVAILTFGSIAFLYLINYPDIREYFNNNK